MNMLVLMLILNDLIKTLLEVMEQFLMVANIQLKIYTNMFLFYYLFCEKLVDFNS